VNKTSKWLSDAEQLSAGQSELRSEVQWLTFNARLLTDATAFRGAAEASIPLLPETEARRLRPIEASLWRRRSAINPATAILAVRTMHVISGF
jgi:hypothetical protein